MRWRCDMVHKGPCHFDWRSELSTCFPAWNCNAQEPCNRTRSVRMPLFCRLYLLSLIAGIGIRDITFCSGSSRSWMSGSVLRNWVYPFTTMDNHSLFYEIKPTHVFSRRWSGIACFCSVSKRQKHAVRFVTLSFLSGFAIISRSLLFKR